MAPRKRKRFPKLSPERPRRLIKKSVQTAQLAEYMACCGHETNEFVYLPLSNHFKSIDVERFPLKICDISFLMAEVLQPTLIGPQTLAYLWVDEQNDFYIITTIDNDEENDDQLTRSNLALTKLVLIGDEASMLREKLTLDRCTTFFQVIGSNMTTKRLVDMECRVEKNQVGARMLTITFRLSKDAIFKDYKSLEANFDSRNRVVQQLMSLIFDYCYLDDEYDDKFREPLSFDQLYATLYQRRKIKSGLYKENEKLVPSLRLYQIESVEWMLDREVNRESNEQDNHFVMHTIDGWQLFYHKILGHLVTEKVYETFCINFNQVNGGLLADEMGLGKTVETFALILNNQRKLNKINFNKIINEFNIFLETDDPMVGDLQCNCGRLDQDETFRIVENNISREELIDICLENGYYLNADCIKCLSCGHYQHIDCSNYPIDNDELNEDVGRFPYLCSRCWLKLPTPIPSKATLVVAPGSIIDQWRSEVEKHTKDMKVFIYQGARTREYIFPPVLASYDIVLTTYEVLRTEIDFIDSINTNHLRRMKRYFCQLTPLLAIDWWRLCLDEAQMVKGTFSQVSLMVKGLKSTFRWAITGTPIGTSVNDLFGIFHYIVEQPLMWRLVWEMGYYLPYCKGTIEPLLQALCHCFWRTPKVEVFDQLGLMRPIYKTEYLDFSQIERDCYRSRLDRINQVKRDVLERYNPDDRLNELSHHVQEKVIRMSLRLRMLCCYPILEANRSAGQTRIKIYSSMAEVLDRMIKEAKVDCEKAHREMIFAMIPRAGVYMLIADFKQAAATYREAIQSVNHYEKLEVRTDRTQKFHLYYNLAEVLEVVFNCKQIDVEGNFFPPFQGSQLTQETLPEEVKNLVIDLEPEDVHLRMKSKQIFQDFITKFELECLTSNRYRLELTDQFEEIIKSYKLKGKWYIYALNILVNEPTVWTELSVLVTKDLPSFYRGGGEVSLEMMRMRLVDYMQTLEETRKEMVDIFEGLTESIVNRSIFQPFIDCHVKKMEDAKKKIKDGNQKLVEPSINTGQQQQMPSSLSSKQPKEKCALCRANVCLDQYENRLFNVYRVNMLAGGDEKEETSDEEESSEDETEVGDLLADDCKRKKKRKKEKNWNENSLLTALRYLAGQFQQRCSEKVADYATVFTDIETFERYLEQVKNEFKAYRKYWTDMAEYVLQVEEMKQASARLKLTEFDVDISLNKYRADQTACEKKLANFLIRFNYLKNLKQFIEGSGKEDGEAAERRICSICFDDMANRRHSMLRCGHFFCLTCYEALRKQFEQQQVCEVRRRCPICRTKFSYAEVAQIDPLAKPTSSEVDKGLKVMKVKGDLPTKLLNIVRLVRQIINKDEKVLIFCSWPSILKIVRDTLAKNGIVTEMVTGAQGGYVQKLARFRSMEDNCNVLLLPTKFACRGLNLTEASHIIFVNSTLLKVDEQQAVGRISRIGQQRQTYVHKFLIRNTIEKVIEEHRESVYHKKNVTIETAEFGMLTLAEYFDLFD